MKLRSGKVVIQKDKIKFFLNNYRPTKDKVSVADVLEDIIEEIEKLDIENTDIEDNTKMAGKFDFTVFKSLVQEFDGNSKNLGRFIQCCELMLTDLEPEEKVIFMKHLICKLQGAAYELYRLKNYEDWSTLKEDLIKRFSKSKPIENIQTELRAIKQELGESISAYAEKINIKLYELTQASKTILINGAGADNHFAVLNNKIAYRVFVEGLLPDMKLLIKARNYTTLEEAIQGALEEETYKSDSKKYQTQIKIICYKCKKPGHTSVQCRNSSVTCYKCGKIGHTSTQCYSNKITCYKCGKDGHLSTQCTIKNKAMSCYKCGKEGHLSKDCRNGNETQRKITCYKCGKEGHISTQCANNFNRPNNRFEKNYRTVNYTTVPEESWGNEKNEVDMAVDMGTTDMSN